jgi:hypothetical protein
VVEFAGSGTTVEQAVVCWRNWDNRRRYALRYKPKDQDTPVLVRSVRYQGSDGKGDSSERLIAVDMDRARFLFVMLAHTHKHKNDVVLQEVPQS